MRIKARNLATSGRMDCVARCIARSDRDDFTPELRRDVFIPLLVENPYVHELHDEGKSFLVSGVEVPEALVAMTRTTVLRRRLADGNIAIERYDLSEQPAIAHLVEVLKPLAPAVEPGNTVWVRVTGPVEAAGQPSAGPTQPHSARWPARCVPTAKQAGH